jgi:hypothetical protein
MKELTMAELSAGVRALVGRMESNPSEFYGEAEKWRFMFSATFRDVLTEPEKGALHEGLKEVRRKEFDEKVMRELLKDRIENQLTGDTTPYFTTAQIGNGGTGFGQATIKAEGKYVRPNTTSTTSLQLGKQTLSEQDLERIKEATTSSNLFK